MRIFVVNVRLSPSGFMDLQIFCGREGLLYAGVETYEL